MWVRLGLCLVLAGGVGMANMTNSDEAVALAKRTLAEHLKSSDRAEIAVVRTEPVDWPDTALGCPEPGMMYAQVIVSGYRVVLSVNGKEYPVHVGSGQAIVCTRSVGRKTMD